MPRPRVAMRRIGEVLRLKYELGLSESEIARGARLARSTVREYLDRAGASGLGYDEACGLADEELDRRLFAARDARDMDRPLPDWEVVEKELRRRGVTMKLLWLEYLSQHPGGYRYTQFCRHFHAWQRASRPPVMPGCPRRRDARGRLCRHDADRDRRSRQHRRRAGDTLTSDSHGARSIGNFVYGP